MTHTDTQEESLPDLFASQVSLTEWLEGINHTRKQDIRDEDSGKPERLRILNESIALPYDRPTTFSAEEIDQRSDRLVAYVEKEGNTLCALRLAPLASGLPKLRIRGSTVRHAVETWFSKQAIDPKLYRADFFIHPTQTNWSTIFVVNKHGIFGEVIAGGHQYLTQGFYNDTKPHSFSLNFQNHRWSVYPRSKDALNHVKGLVRYLLVPDDNSKNLLKEKLNVDFVCDYLRGYFETVDSEFGTYFIDFNRLLGELYADFVYVQSKSLSDTLTGIVGSQGKE